MFNTIAFLGLGLAASSIIIVAVLLILAFEIWMLVSAVTNKAIATNAKVWWIVGMFLIHPFVAIAYYFTDYKKKK